MKNTFTPTTISPQPTLREVRDKNRKSLKLAWAGFQIENSLISRPDSQWERPIDFQCF